MDCQFYHHFQRFVIRCIVLMKQHLFLQLVFNCSNNSYSVMYIRVGYLLVSFEVPNYCAKFWADEPCLWALSSLDAKLWLSIVTAVDCFPFHEIVDEYYPVQYVPEYTLHNLFSRHCVFPHFEVGSFGPLCISVVWNPK